MKPGAPTFGAKLKSLREAAGFTQEELATIAGLSVHAVSALERGQRRRPHPETVRALSTALDLPATVRDALLQTARMPGQEEAAAEPKSVSLPRALTTLVGRDTDLATLKRWLADPAVRMITLVGTGGVGKTRLALEIAQTVAEAHTIRVVFAGLESVRDALFVASAIAEAFGSSDVAPADLPSRIGASCEGRPTLLVLDNCEHVLDAVPLVASVVAAVPSLRVLATSRTPLRIAGEREYAVGPLALDPVNADDRALAPAVRLFVDRVLDVCPDFRLTDANASVVAAICRRLDALPLALELAAPWLKVLPPEDLLRRLEVDSLPPTIGRRDLPERQKAMNATVAWSYQLLAADEQRAFRRLGVLPGRFPIEAAAAVVSEGRTVPATVDETLQVAAGLLERSLLLRAESSLGTRPLYRMLETVRAYTAGELTASGERDVAMDGLARYCLTAAIAAGDNLAGHAQGEWLDRVRDDLESFRSALTWLIEHGRAKDACDIAWSLLFFWLIRGHAAEGLRWYEQLANLEPLSTPAYTRALAGASVMWYALGDLDRARSACERCLMRPGADAAAVAVAENILGHVELAVRNLRAARDRFANARRRFEEQGIAWGIGTALAGMAWTALAAGDLDETDRFVAEAAAVLSTVGPWNSEIVFYVRAVLAVRRDKPEEAIGYVRESLARIHALSDKFALVYALVPLAAAAELTGDDAWAARVLGARDGVTERTGATVVDDSVRDLRERVDKDARARLGPRRWAREYEAGRNASVESLLKEIDGRRQTTRIATVGGASGC